MTCSKTGKGVLYGSNHYYPGDEFYCSGCGATVINTNASAWDTPEGWEFGEEGVNYIRGVD